jgi:signal transduction histidine kinase
VLPSIVSVVLVTALAAIVGILLLGPVTLASGYRVAGLPVLVLELAWVASLVIAPIALVALCGVVVARWASRQRVGMRVRGSIRTRLMVSHLVAVTASTFIYATGGFILLILLLIGPAGYRPAQLPYLLPEFAVVTLLVLLQIGLITLCGVVVARWASGYLSRRIVRQITELEAATEEFARGRLDRRVRVMAPDELGRLAERFNLLASQLDELDRQRRSFVANVSHDLRTPIAIIRGHIDAQLNTSSDDGLDPRASFAAIERETQTLAKLIDDLFTLSRVEEGVLPVARLPVRLQPLAQQTVESIRPYALATSRVSVHADVPPDVPPALGDEARIAQILGNLLHNAVRHTPAGGVVMLRARGVDAARQVELSVEDTGVGIAPDELPHIFDRFYQGESVRESGGTGLGLSIVKQLVEIQGGTVSATSRLGEGTRIAFRLPAAPRA